jgi:hypothetical protein
MSFVSSLRTIREPKRELAFTLACANPGAVLVDISHHVQTEGRGYEERAAASEGNMNLTKHALAVVSA